MHSPLLTYKKTSPEIDTLAGCELVEVLIKRGENSNAFEFITAQQMARLVIEWNKEHPKEQLLLDIIDR